MKKRLDSNPFLEKPVEVNQNIVEIALDGVKPIIQEKRPKRKQSLEENME